MFTLAQSLSEVGGVNEVKRKNIIRNIFNVITTVFYHQGEASVKQPVGETCEQLWDRLSSDMLRHSFSKS